MFDKMKRKKNENIKKIIGLVAGFIVIMIGIIIIYIPKSEKKEDIIFSKMYGSVQ